MRHAFLARLCAAAYPGSPDAPLLGNAEEIGGLTPTCYLLEGAPGTPVILIFRGTSNIEALTEDLDFRLAPCAAGGQVHEGFQAGWNSLCARVRRWLGFRRCIIAGHSLGGAIATLAGLDLAADAVITFGSPRVGDAEFAAAYNALKIPTVRYVYQLDPVPWTPPALWNGYRHVCPPRWQNGLDWQTDYSWCHWAKMLARAGVSWPNLFAKLRGFHQIGHYLDADGDTQQMTPLKIFGGN